MGFRTWKGMGWDDMIRYDTRRPVRLGRGRRLLVWCCFGLVLLGLVWLEMGLAREGFDEWRFFSFGPGVFCCLEFGGLNGGRGEGSFFPSFRGERICFGR